VKNLDRELLPNINFHGAAMLRFDTQPIENGPNAFNEIERPNLDR
jgi:hypothetical protein